MKQILVGLLIGAALWTGWIAIFAQTNGDTSAVIRRGGRIPEFREPKTRWLNEDLTAHAEWHYQEFRKRHGKMADNVSYGYMWNTNAGKYAVDVGTNRFDIELGFRDDGVVVWRKVKTAQ